MPSDTPTNPNFPIPSAAGIVAVVGKTPLPVLLDLNGDGIPDYNQKWLRDTLGGALFKALTVLFGKTPWGMVLLQYQPEIQALIDRGAK